MNNIENPDNSDSINENNKRVQQIWGHQYNLAQQCEQDESPIKNDKAGINGT